jgi:hypothetical protein
VPLITNSHCLPLSGYSTLNVPAVRELCKCWIWSLPWLSLSLTMKFSSVLPRKTLYYTLAAWTLIIYYLHKFSIFCFSQRTAFFVKENQESFKIFRNIFHFFKKNLTWNLHNLLIKLFNRHVLKLPHFVLR